MKKRLFVITALLLVMALALTACGGSKDKEGSSDSKSGGGSDATVVKTIDEIDTEGMEDEPLELESVTLYDDGTVRVVPTGKVKEIAETNDEIKDGAAYPFADAGKVKDIYLVRFGNGGYRTVIALMDDGSLSALSANDLIKEHILVVMPNVSNRDDFVSVEQDEDDDAYKVIGKTKKGDEIELDYSLDF